MKKWIGWIIVALIILMAYITNPDVDKHKLVLNNRLTEAIDQAMLERNNDIEQMAWQLGKKEITSMFIDKYMTVDDYKVLSLTRIHWAGKSYIVGIGGFEQVYITRKLDKELAHQIIDNVDSYIQDFIPNIKNALPDILNELGF